MIKNFKIKIITIILASIFWVFIITSHDQIKSLNYDLTIDTIGLSDDLILLDENKLPKIKLYYRATSANILTSKLSIEDFSTSIKVEGLIKGTYTAPIFVEANHPDIEIVDFSPKEIDITLDTKIAKEFVPELTTNGRPAEGYKVTNLIGTYDSIEIIGAESIIKKIDVVQAQVDLLGSESTDQVQKAKLRAYTANKKIIEDIETDPEFLVVDIEISPDEETKIVGIIPNLNKVTLKDGFFVKSVKINPAFATIRGKHINVKDINNLETINLSISQLDDNYETSLDLNLPQDISIINPSDNKANLNIEVESLHYQKEVEVVIKHTGLSNEFSIQYDTPISVILTGTPDTLNSIDEDDIVANINFDNMNSSGVKRVEINKSDFIYPQDLKLIDYNPKLWEVTVNYL